MSDIAVKFPFLTEKQDFTLPASISIEQASSQDTAEFKTSLVQAGKLFADMTGGMGIDTIFFSRKFDKAIYIERSPELCELARHNFSALGLNNIEVVNADSTEHIKLVPFCDTIYIDAARRSLSGGKLVSIADCEPNILPILDTIRSKCNTLLVKLSPMLDITTALSELQSVKELYVVSVKNECKELLALIDNTSGNTIQTTIHCINLPFKSDFTFTQADEAECSVEQSMPLCYLYEPDTSILKAGAFKSIGVRFNLYKLHTNSHLYTSDKLIENFPGRTFHILDCRKVHKEHFKDIPKANLTVRNFPTPVSQIRKNLHLLEGGDLYLFATTLMDGTKRILVCEKTI